MVYPYLDGVLVFKSVWEAILVTTASSPAEFLELCPNYNSSTDSVYSCWVTAFAMKFPLTFFALPLYFPKNILPAVSRPRTLENSWKYSKVTTYFNFRALNININISISTLVWASWCLNDLFVIKEILWIKWSKRIFSFLKIFCSRWVFKMVKLIFSRPFDDVNFNT